MSQTTEQRRLEALIGTWKTEGWTREMPGAPAARIDALDTYDWLPGRCALLHRVDARVGDQTVEGAEIIGYDPTRRTYLTQYFGTDGAAAYEASLNEDGDTLEWAMSSEKDRFAGTFSPDRNSINGHWESRTADGSWQPWMDITLAKQAN